MTKRKLKVLVLAGGPSFEHEVSLRTAQMILKNLDPKKLADKVFGLVQPSLAADAALTVADVRLAIDAAKDLPLGEDEDPDVAEDEKDEDVA